MAETIEKVAPTIVNPPLTDRQVSIEKMRFSQTQSLVDSQVPDTDVLVNTIRTQVKGVMQLDPQPSPYGAPPLYTPQETLIEPAQKPKRAIVGSPSIVYPAGMG